MLHENKEGMVTISITPDVMLHALTLYVNEHILKEPLKVVDVSSFGFPVDHWSLKCATTLQRLGGKDA